MRELRSLAVRPLPKNDIVESEELIGQQVFLYAGKEGEVHCLNGGAAIIWLLCDGKRDVEGIASEIASTYGLWERKVLTEVQETLTQFQSLNLLEVESDEA